MMNLQIVSNSINKIGKVNYTNDFNMSLQQPIDAENVDKHIKVMRVSYPLTTKNINDDRCFFYLKIGYANFKKDAHVDSTQSVIYPRSQLVFHTEKFHIPQGIYEITDIIRFFNAKCQQFDVNLRLLENGMVQFECGFTLRYMYMQSFDDGSGTTFDTKALNRWHYGDVDHANNDEILGGMRIEVYLSPKLYYMLGEFEGSHKAYVDELESDVYAIEFFSSDSDSKIRKCLERTKWSETKVAMHLPNHYIGVNRIFIYCDEVEKTMIADQLVPLLTVVPLQYKGQGTVELVSFVPSPVPRKLIKSKIHSLNIRVTDAKGELINFDSGSINLDCVIY